jgi:myo-inositol-1(or 4)-monophosphatase
VVDWLSLFERTAWKIRERVKPLFGSEEGGKSFGRGAGGDVSKKIDILAEEIVVKTLEDSGVSCILVSEERGVKRFGVDESSGYVVLDGIDGTTNAVHGLPFVSTSLAFAEGPRLNDVRMGLVMDFSNDTIFHAEKGMGSFQDEKRLKTASVTDIQDAVISFELGYPRDREKQIQCLLPIIGNSKKIRILGSTALELCYIASGALDAFIDVREMARATDLAAAQLILTEAGGMSVTPEGCSLNLTLNATATASIIATSNQRLCKNILERLNVNRNKD